MTVAVRLNSELQPTVLARETALTHRQTETNGHSALLNGLVVCALGIRTRGPRFDSRVAPLFHWVATLASCLLTLPPQFLSSKKLGTKGGFLRLSGYGG